MTDPIRYVITADSQGFFAQTAEVQRRLASMAEGVTGFAQSLGVVGFASGLGFGALAAAVGNSISALDDLNDRSQAIGIAADQLSTLELSARAAGVSQEALSSGVSKFATVLEGAISGNKEAAETIRLLGIDQEALRNGTINTADALRIAADTLSGYEEGFRKVALARDAFGKGGGAFLAWLNEGAAGLSKFSGASAESIEQAAKLSDQVDKLSAAWERFKLSIGGFAARALLPREEVQSNQAAIAGIEQSIGLIEQRLRSGDYDNVGWLERSLFGVKGREGALQELATLRAQLEGLRNGGRDDVQGGRTLKPVPDRAKEPQSVRAEADAYTPLVRAIRERISVMEAEAREGEKLSEVQRFAAKTLADIEAGYIKLNPAQKAAVTDYLGEAAALDQLAQAREADRKALEDFDRATRDYLRAQEQQREGINALIQSHLDEITTLSGTREEIARMQAERELERLGIDKTSEAYQRYLDLLVDLKGQRAAIEENRRVWQSINEAANDAFIEIYKGGQGVFDRLKNTLERGLLQLLYEMTVKKWLVQIETQVNNQSGGDIFGWLIKLIGAAASGGSSAGADTAGAAGSTGGDAFGGQTWSAKASDWSGVMGSAKSGGLSVNYNIGQVGSGVSRADVVAAMEETRAATKADLLDGMARGKYRMAASTHG